MVDQALPRSFEARALLAVAPAADEPGFVLEPQVVSGPRFQDDLRASLPPAGADDPPWRETLRGVLADLAPSLAEERLVGRVRDDGRGLELIAVGSSEPRAEALAETVAERLLAARLERRRMALDERQAAVEAAIAAVEATIAEREGRLGLADAPALDEVQARLAALTAERDAAEARLAAAAEAVERAEVAAVEPLDLDWLLARPRADALADAVQARTTASLRLAEIDVVYGVLHPLHEAARAERDAREAAVRNAAAALVRAERAERDLAAAALERLEGELDAARGELAARQSAVADAAALEREIAAERQRLQEWAATRNTLQRQRLGLLDDARLVATSEAIAVDRRATQAVVYAAGGGLGLFAGWLVARRRAGYRPRRFTSAATLANATGQPVLAAIPPLPRRIERVAKHRAGAAIERVWLQGEAAPVPIRTLAVAGADRTVDAARLAAALAQTGSAQGYTVLVIDAGAPALPLHRLWRLADGPGIAEVWAGERAWTDLLVPLGARGPWLLRRGAPGRGALAPGAVEVLLQSAERRFDRIVVATAPLSDTQGLRVARACRSTLVAVRAGVTRRHAIETALQELRAVGGDPLGLVLMDAPRRA